MDINQRIEMIRKRVEQFSTDIKRTHSVRWRGKNLDLPVIQLKTKDLRYRLENGRTRRKQKQYLMEHSEVPTDLFNDPESNIAQEAQHEILLEFIGQKGLLDDLLSEKQREPAIITYDGYVLNGNRRLAALREIKTEDIDCVVLPKDADPRDLYDLEIDLQMRRETKAEYNWVDELLNIRYGIEVIEEDYDSLAKRMRIDVREIRKKMATLALVDLYLEWLGKPEQHFIVEGDEQAFKELEVHISKIKDHEKSEFIREQAFALIKFKPGEGRVYTDIKDLGKHFEKTQEKMMGEDSVDITVEEEEENEDESDEIGTSYSVDPDDPLTTMLEMGEDKKEDTQKKKSIKKAFQSPSSAKKNVNKLIEFIKEIKEEEKEKNSNEAAFNSVNIAHRKLASVVIEKTTLKKDVINTKLDEIIKSSNDIKRKIKSIEKDGDE